MSATVWGPPLWAILFTAASKLKEAHASDMVAMLHCLNYILPCEVCRQSYRTFYARNPPHLSVLRGQDAMRWLWKCKDAVNRKTGRVSRPEGEIHQRYNVTHSATSEFAVLDALILLSDIPDDRSAHVIEFAKRIGIVMEHVLGASFCNRLRMCGAAIDTHTSVAIRRLLVCLLDDVCHSKGIARLSCHAV